VRRGSIAQLIALGVVLGGAAAAVAVLIPWLPPSASKERDRIDFVFWFATVICIGIFAVVAAVIVYAVLKFRARPEDDSDGPPIHGHTGLEIFWTAVPAFLVTAIAIVSGVVLVKNSRAGPNPLIVNVTAQQFTWSFSYPSGKNVGSGQLYLPLGRKVELRLNSVDVIHSFWVPEFGQKQDALPNPPGHYQKLVITPNKIGTYPVICTELCGLGHALMRSQAIVLKPAAFETWLAQQGKTATGGAGGAAIFKAQGCGSCHRLAAARTTGKVGPDLDKLSAEAKKAGQPLEQFVRTSISDPNAYIEPGYPKGVMPNFGKILNTAQIDALVKFLTGGKKR
jgi:cytochrome c oxidase subunit 2